MPGRDSRGRAPVRVALATGATVAFLLAMPVSAGLAAPGASAQRRPAQAGQDTPPADVAARGVRASEPAGSPPVSPAPAGDAAESSGGDAAPGPVDGPPAEPVYAAPGGSSESTDPEQVAAEALHGGAETAPGEAEPADGPAYSARGIADPVPGPAEPSKGSADPAPRPADPAPAPPDPANGFAGHLQGPADPADSAAPLGIDLVRTGTLFVPGGAATELPPGETSPAPTITPFTEGMSALAARPANALPAAADLRSPLPFARKMDAAPVPCVVGCAAFQPGSVESGTRPADHSARPRPKAAGRRGGDIRRQAPGRVPQSPDGAVCSSSGACAPGPPAMVPVLAALGCLCALFVEWLVPADDGWRSHRFVSLRERPG
jgi:hypothetical protein